MFTKDIYTINTECPKNARQTVWTSKPNSSHNSKVNTNDFLLTSLQEYAKPNRKAANLTTTQLFQFMWRRLPAVYMLLFILVHSSGKKNPPLMKLQGKVVHLLACHSQMLSLLNKDRQEKHLFIILILFLPFWSLLTSSYTTMIDNIFYEQTFKTFTRAGTVI